MIIRKLRLERGWSQDQLARLSGLSTRTIQRIERGQNPGLESLKSLAAVFDVNVVDLKKENEMDNKIASQEELDAVEYVKELKGFYSHLITYFFVVVALLAFNLMTAPTHLWVIWVAFGWGVGVAAHAVNVFEVFNWFGADWEKRQIEKKLGKKL